MPTIHALLAGITDYPDYNQRLFGCLNDVAAMNEFFRRYAESQNLTYRPEIKRNKDATRQGLIDAFSHFDQAQDGDICVFFFSGHGSFAEAPKAFWNNPTGRNESIVCYDSRLPDGRDLMDKELSFLIWQAAQGKKIHFLAIMDCCHAGSSTRNLKGAKERWAPPAHTPPGPEEYLGFEHYQRREDGQVSPPTAPHVLLAASRDNETAKEDYIQGGYRGVFSHALLQELEQGGIFASYAELLQRTGLKVQSLAVQQNPQLETVDVAPGMGFLGQKPKKGLPFQIAFDRKAGAWMLEAGSLQNIAPSSPSMQTLLELEDGATVAVTEVGMSKSAVTGMDGKDKGKTYRAWLRQNALPAMPVFFDPALPDAWKNELEKQIGDIHALRIVEEEQQGQYVVRPYENALILTKRGEEIPVFKRMPVDDLAFGVNTFLKDVKDVANWEHVLLHHNPQTKLRSEHLKVEVFVFSSPEYRSESVEQTVLVNPAEPVELRYFNVNGKEKKPGFQVRITNLNPKQSLWVSAIILSSDYGIDNQLLRKQELQPGQEVWLSYWRNGEMKKTLESFIDEAYLSWGVNEITDFIKVYASTAEVNTDPLVQQAIELDIKKGMRSSTRGIRAAIEAPTLHDWTTKTITVKTHRPLDETPIAEGQEAKIPGLSIQAPAGFSAKVSLTSLGPTTRSLNTPIPPAFWNYPQSHVMPLTRGLDRTDGLEMLEIIGAQGREQVTADNPIEIRLQQPLQAEESVVPIGYDPESGLFFPVGLTDEEGRVLIQQLPDDTPTGQRSLGGSIKLFFQKIIGQRIGMEKDLYKLRRVTVTPDAELTYEPDDLEAIRKAVKADNCTHVALFIHGIIGDTTEMPKVLRRVKCAGGGSMMDRYQVVLAFDYENLDTAIDKIAEKLKERLDEAGLGPKHGKTFHIFAHSMGGLVSRWFIEKEDGGEVVTRLFTFGTPHNGSPYSNISELVTMAVTYAVNSSAILQPWLLPLMLAGKLLKKTQLTLSQMKPGGEWLQGLNDGTTPPIPYTIIVGNTQLIDPEKDEKIKGLLRRILARFKNRPHYLLLDALLFGQPNDIAVSTESQQAVASDDVPLVVASDHLCYFDNLSSLKALEEKLNKLNIC